MIDARTYDDYRRIFRGVPMPFAFVDLDLFWNNAEALVRRARGKKIRLGTKGIRCTALLRRLLDHRPQFAGLMCYSASEAAFLSRKGFDDLLVAYPVWQKEQLESLCHEAGAEKRLAVMFDSPDHLERYNAIAAARGVVLGVCLDLDVASRFPFLHFGVKWSEVSSEQKIRAVCDRLSSLKNVRLVGMMGYEGQIAALPDNVKGNLKNPLIRLLKRASVRSVMRKRADAARVLRKAGYDLQFVNGGGTGSLDSTSRDDVVTEVTAGSGFYSPATFDHYRDFKHLPAAAYAVEITRKGMGGAMVCHGGGYNASGIATPLKEPVPYLPQGVRLSRHEGAGEVQTPVVYEGKEELRLGDPIFFRHAKAGELCERVNTLHLVSQGRIVDQVPTYRGEGMCFL